VNSIFTLVSLRISSCSGLSKHAVNSLDASAQPNPVAEKSESATLELTVQRKLDVSQKSTTESRRNAGKELIVIASLITRAANLGGNFRLEYLHLLMLNHFSGLGLCRTCEIFGVSTLVLGNCTIISDPEFKSLSMSAEKWVRVEEVTEIIPLMQRLCTMNK
jgi:tRNA G18 (ribose-2'-O)-methylase SpoU